MKSPVRSGVVFALLGALLWPHQAVAQTVRYVDSIRTCDDLDPCYATIMDAVDAAQPSDTIEVFPGVYHENVVIQGSLVGVRKDNIVLRAHDPALKPVIAAPSGGAAVFINVAAQVQVLNFVLEGGVGIGSPTSQGFVVEGNRIRGGLGIQAAAGGTVSDNTFVGGGVVGDLQGAIIEGNTFVDGSILIFEGSAIPGGNTIRHNVLRRGGIRVGAPSSDNLIDSNFVSGSSGDGISVGVPLHANHNVIRNNTSIENAGCDINDPSDGGNTWTNNRFGTQCGAATE